MDAEYLPHEIYTVIGSKLSRQEEEQRRMKNCAEELENPRNRSKDRGERKFATADLLRKKDDESLVCFRLIQRPLLIQISKVADGGGAPELGRREEEEGTEGEKREGPSGLIYRGKSKTAGARIKEPETAE